MKEEKKGFFCEIIAIKILSQYCLLIEEIDNKTYFKNFNTASFCCTTCFFNISSSIMKSSLLSR